ncbi:MAG TPA: D-cysteine desulfhydrase family protein [Dongiaceae bacterium]|jgi:L-cysteate sulfo-lyase|nr:D-cysteine desulfhydrase family protein [Dongiaceae bacterium]
MPLSKFPRFALAHLPTPLEPLDRLRRHLGGPRLYIKRDDCTGLALGGNKTRKAEFLIGAALAAGATCVVTEGGLQSNHVRQIAAAAAKAGLKCHLVLDHQVPIITSPYRENGNLLLDRVLGATIHLCEAGQTRADAVARLLPRLRNGGEAPYHIPTGGSNETGALGYAAAALELLSQAKKAGISIDRVLFATASGGTQAGLVVGMALAAARVQVLGIDIEGEADGLLAEVRTIAEACAGKVGLNPPLPEDAVAIRSGYAGPGYGLPTSSMLEAVGLLARLEGIVLDPVYTGKAMAGLVDLVRSGHFGADETVVFIHTGGMPAMFAYADCF